MPNPRTGTLERHFLYNVNPLLKMGVAIGFTSLAFALHHLYTLGFLCGILLILVLISVKIPLKIWFFSIISVVVFLVWSEGFREQTPWIVSFLRLGAILLPSPLLAGTTRPADLIRGLEAVQISKFMILSLILIWRFLPLMQQETYRIIEANQLRGINLFFRPQFWFSGLFIPLIFRIVAYADDVTVGLETRGYDPIEPRSNSQPLTWKRADTIFLGGAVAIITILTTLEWKLFS